MNAPLVFAFAGVGVAATFLAAVWLALTAGVWVWNQTRQNEPVPYYPADGLARLAAAIHNEPSIDFAGLRVADFDEDETPYDQVVVERELALLKAAWALPSAEVDR